MGWWRIHHTVTGIIVYIQMDGFVYISSWVRHAVYTVVCYVIEIECLTFGTNCEWQVVHAMQVGFTSFFIMSEEKNWKVQLDFLRKSDGA